VAPVVQKVAVAPTVAMAVLAARADRSKLRQPLDLATSRPAQCQLTLELRPEVPQAVAVVQEPAVMEATVAMVAMVETAARLWLHPAVAPLQRWPDPMVVVSVLAAVPVMEYPEHQVRLDKMAHLAQLAHEHRPNNQGVFYEEDPSVDWFDV
jgi:hypothetical protein